MKKKGEIKTYCPDCMRETNHLVVAEIMEPGSEEYRCRTYYEIVQCRGCDSYSYRTDFHDHESVYQIGPNEYDFPRTETRYPTFLNNHRMIDTFEIPKLIAKLYHETVCALRDSSSILAGLGLRSIIEAVCNDRKIDEENLVKKIDALSTSGYISRKNADLLHGVRFLGNDAAHDIRAPKRAQIWAALKIIEHMLESIYVLRKAAEDVLDYRISDVSDFIKLIFCKIAHIKNGEELSLVKILGKDRRRVQEHLLSFERELQNRISEDTFFPLRLGKRIDLDGREHQLYIVARADDLDNEPLEGM